jgi:hypothetical protein
MGGAFRPLRLQRTGADALARPSADEGPDEIVDSPALSILRLVGRRLGDDAATTLAGILEKAPLAAPARGRRVVNARADGPRDVDAAGERASSANFEFPGGRDGHSGTQGCSPRAPASGGRSESVAPPAAAAVEGKVEGATGATPKTAGGGARGAGFPSATRIGGIDLSANELTARGAGAVLAAVGQRPALRRSLLVVDLGANALGDAGAAAVARCFGAAPGSANFEFPALRELWLPSNGIGCAGATAIACALRRSLRALALLSLDNNRIECDGAEAIARALSPRMRPKMARDGDGDERDEIRNSARAGGSLAGAKEADPSRANLGISAARSTPPRSESAASRDADLGEGAELRALRLSFNRVGDLGAAALADAVQRQTARSPGPLRELTLSRNPAGHIGMRALALTLGGSALETLDCSATRCNGAGAWALVRAALRSDSLRSLDLRFCDGIDEATLAAMRGKATVKALESARCRLLL